MGWVEPPRKPTVTGFGGVGDDLQAKFDLLGVSAADPAHHAERPGLVLLRRRAMAMPG